MSGKEDISREWRKKGQRKERKIKEEWRKEQERKASDELKGIRIRRNANKTNVNNEMKKKWQEENAEKK